MSDVIAMHRSDLVDAVTEAVKPLRARIDQLESDLEGARLINKLQAEALAEERHIHRQWLAANSPGGWIDDLRKASQANPVGKQE